MRTACSEWQKKVHKQDSSEKKRAKIKYHESIFIWFVFLVSSLENGKN